MRHSGTYGRSVGEVLAITPSGRVTLRSPSEDVVVEGTLLQDRSGSFRGRVVRVFGPVARPYLSVQPRRLPSPEAGAALIGQSLFPAEG
jgi:rRNA processing protein Gar1